MQRASALSFHYLTVLLAPRDDRSLLADARSIITVRQGWVNVLLTIECSQSWELGPPSSEPTNLSLIPPDGRRQRTRAVFDQVILRNPSGALPVVRHGGGYIVGRFPSKVIAPEEGTPSRKCIRRLGGACLPMNPFDKDN